MNQEDAYRAYDCVRKEFPGYANFEGCPWVETIDRTWVRSNAGYLMEVTQNAVRVAGPTFEKVWPVRKMSKDVLALTKELEDSLSEAPIG